MRKSQQEITRSKQDEEKIRRAAEEWRTLFDSIDDPVSIHDKDFMIVRANKAFAAAFGKDIRELLGKKCYEVVHGTHEPCPACPHRQTLISGHTVTEAFSDLRQGKFLQVSVYPILNGSNEITSSVHILRDITERKRMEEALQRSELQFRNLVETTSDWVWEVDSNGVYTYASPRVTDILGYKPEEVLGKTPFDFMPEDEAVRVASIFDDIKTQGKHFWGLENTNLHQDGRLVVLETNGVPFYDAEGRLAGYRGVDRDITTKKKIQDALQDAHDDLEARVKERTADLALANKRLSASEKNLEEQLKFETMLAEISARFVNLPAAQVDKEILRTQRHICDLLAFDRSTLWQIPENDPDMMLLTYIHQPRESRPAPERANAADLFPWSTRKILNGEIITISKMSDLPPEAARDVEAWNYYTTKSSMLIPLSTGGGKIFGVLTFAVTREERDWPEPIVKQLRLVAELFANALARKYLDAQVREAEERFRLATNAAGAGLWVIEPDAGRLFVTEKTIELFHLVPGELLNFENFIGAIEPGDRKKFDEDIQYAVQSGEDFRNEYKVLSHDGVVRWILCSGRLHPESNTESARVMGVFIDITEQKIMEEQLKSYILQIEQLKEKIQKENIYLHEELKLLEKDSNIIGFSPPIKKTLSQVEQVAQTDSTVLILGETGVGKELVARAIHRMSKRRARPLVSVNCASLPPSLIESELFGREKGAYTGALTKMVGRFEIANGSTIFLDEISEIPLELQSKLLRVLETGNIERLGSTKTLHVDVRIIAATNRDIDQDVQNGRFRKDLFYRLNVFPILVPPLRERREDIPLMVWSFAKDFQKAMGKKIFSIPDNIMEELQNYSWPGNVRELRNVVERAMITSSDNTFAIQLPKTISSNIHDPHNFKDMERMHILNALEKCHWRVGGKGGAAEFLGLKRSTLYSKMEKLGINRSNS